MYLGEWFLYRVFIWVFVALNGIWSVFVRFMNYTWGWLFLITWAPATNFGRWPLAQSIWQFHPGASGSFFMWWFSVALCLYGTIQSVSRTIAKEPDFKLYRAIWGLSKRTSRQNG